MLESSHSQWVRGYFMDIWRWRWYSRGIRFGYARWALHVLATGRHRHYFPGQRVTTCTICIPDKQEMGSYLSVHKEKDAGRSEFRQVQTSVADAIRRTWRRMKHQKMKGADRLQRKVNAEISINLWLVRNRIISIPLIQRTLILSDGQ
jgi:hypothetical protein